MFWNDNQMNKWAVNIYKKLGLNSKILSKTNEDELRGINIMGNNIIHSI